jgi:hypothetical protein
VSTLPKIQDAIYGDVEKLGYTREVKGAGNDIGEMVNQSGGRTPAAQAGPGTAARTPTPQAAQPGPAAFQLPEEAAGLLKAERELVVARDFWVDAAMAPGADAEVIEYALMMVDRHKAAYESAYQGTPNINFRR